MRSHLRERRQQRGLTQRELAAAAGVTRQTVGGIESGRYGPGVEVGLRLARALGCHVEDLFSLEAGPGPEVAAVGAGLEGSAAARVVLGEVAGRRVARALRALGDFRWATPAAHGLAHPLGAGPAVSVRPLAGARRGLFLAGCDPALGLLAAHAARAVPDLDALWWQAGNAAAAAQLARGEVHAASLHLTRGAGGAVPGAVRFRLACWEMGWLLAPGNPRGIRAAADLVRPDVVLANREVGSGARTLLDRLLSEAGVAPGRIRGYGSCFPGHLAVAEAVALGAADVAVGPGVAAVERGLAFVPVQVEASDLCLHAAALHEPLGELLLEALQAPAFRLDLAAFGPYDTADTGRRVQEGDVSDGSA